jgi:excisionase family DNA binding protein
MAGKFVELNEAAKQLGISVEKLKEMHSAGEIHGYRDGASVKFKPEEVARIAAELGSGSSGSDIIEAKFDSGSMEDFLASTESSGDLKAEELILDDVDDNPKGSTVIGKKGTAGPMDSGSDLRLAGDSAKGGAPKKGGSSKKIGSDVLGRKPVAPPPEADSGELRLAPDDGSSDDLLGAGSGKLLPTDSGINLKSPVDSGLSLENDALDIKGAPQDSADSFELPEDTDFAAIGDSSSDISSIEELAGSEAFELAPSDGSGFEESSDSGSQIIALEESDSFEAAPVEASESVDFSSMESAAPVEGLDPLGGDAFAAVASPVTGTNAAIASEVSQLWAAPKEAPYSTMSVVSLGLTTVLMLLIGLVMVDMMFNMWSFSGDRTYSSSITDLVASMLPED